MGDYAAAEAVKLSLNDLKVAQKQLEELANECVESTTTTSSSSNLNTESPKDKLPKDIQPIVNNSRAKRKRNETANEYLTVEPVNHQEKTSKRLKTELTLNLREESMKDKEDRDLPNVKETRQTPRKTRGNDSSSTTSQYKKEEV